MATRKVIVISDDYADWQPAPGQPGSSFWACNQPWGKTRPMRNGIDYKQSVEIRPASWPSRAVIRWKWPSYDSPKGVWGYIPIVLGNEDGGKWKEPNSWRGVTSFKPIQLKDLQAFTVTYDVTPGSQRPADYDILSEIWLTDAPDDKNPKIELGVFFHAPDRDTQNARDALVFQGPNYKAFIVNRPGGSDTPFYMVALDVEAMAMTFDWLPLIKFLISKEWLTGDEWFSGVDFGVEPFCNSGSLTINRLSYDIR